MANRYTRFGTAVAAVVLAIVVASWLYGSGRPNARTQEVPGRGEALVAEGAGNERRQVEPGADTYVERPTQAEVVDRGLAEQGFGEGGPGIGGNMNMRAESPAETVRRSSAIVRARVKALREGVHQAQRRSAGDPNLICEVKKVIYGSVPPGDLIVQDTGLAMTVGIDLRRELRREPTTAEITARLQVERKRRGYYEGERDVMIFLGRSQKTDGGTVWLPVSMSIDRPPKNPLDDREKTILDVLKTGKHMTMTPGQTGREDLASFLMASGQVVRARLKGIDRRSCEWEVESLLGVLPGPVIRDLPSPEQEAEQRRAAERELGATLTIELEPWRLRAEALARDQAHRRGEETPAEEDVQSEFDRLVKAELKVGREALLFLKSQKPATGQATYQLVGIAPADPDDPAKLKAFEQFTETVRRAIQNREYLKDRFSLGL